MKVNSQQWPILIFVPFIAWVIWQANTNGKNVIFQTVNKIPFYDKIGHVVLYGMLAVFLEMALSRRKFRKPNYSIAGTIIMTFALLEEITQIWIDSRTFDLIDLLGGFVGVLGFLWIYNNLISRKGIKKPSV